MEKACCLSGCSFPVFTDSQGKCALHCEKHDYHADYGSGLLLDLYNTLLEYLTIKLSHEVDFDAFGIDDAARYLSNFFSFSDEELGKWNEAKSPSIEKKVSSYFKRHEVVFKHITFPVHRTQDKDSFDYSEIFKRIAKVHFLECEFYTSYLPLKESAVFFDKCTFHSTWQLCHGSVLPNNTNTTYERCTFKSRVEMPMAEQQARVHIAGALFGQCQFESSVSLCNAIINDVLFTYPHTEKLCLPELTVEDCELNSPFRLSEATIERLNIKNCEFLGKVEIKDAVIQSAHINNANFRGLFDAHGTSFEEFSAHRVIFEDFAGFEECHFGLNVDAGATEFQFTTFIDLASFRYAKFHNGLNMDTSNLKTPPNFLGVVLDDTHTTRETYRLIKDAFDKIGNHIEANKYFAEEMRKYKQSLSFKKNWSEWFVFQCNERLANYGQSYLRPLTIMVLAAALLSVIRYGHKHNWLYSGGWVQRDGPMNCLIDKINFVAQSLLPFNKLLIEGIEALSLLFYVFFGVLSWLSIVAVKRLTRR